MCPECYFMMSVTSCCRNSAGAEMCLIMLGGTFGFNKKWQMDPGCVHKYFG